MAFAPLILRGALKVNASDVSDQVMQFKFAGARSEINVPATFGKRESFEGGSDTYTVQIDFLQDVDATALSIILWDALTDPVGTIVVSGSLRDGPVGADNPLFTATAVVTAVGLGGTVNTVGTDSVTLRLKDRPVKSII